MQYSKLYNTISSYITLEEEDENFVKSIFNYESVSKGITLIETGKYTDKAYFILSGYLKYFKMLDLGKELIVHLYAPGNFAISLKSFF